MSTIKNGHILLYCHFNKFKKEPGTSLQSTENLSKNLLEMCHKTHYYLTKFHCDSIWGSKEISMDVTSHI